MAKMNSLMGCSVVLIVILFALYCTIFSVIAGTALRDETGEFSKAINAMPILKLLFSYCGGLLMATTQMVVVPLAAVGVFKIHAEWSLHKDKLATGGMK